MENQEKMEKIVSWAKRRGFIYPQDEIYGGLNAIYNFGPYGSLMKNKLREEFLSQWVKKQPNIVGIESAIITKKETLQASGHEAGFTDPLIECKKCHTRFRPDQVEKREVCPDCGSNDLTTPQEFNLMFRSFLGPVEDDNNKIYLRPENAQGMFSSFGYIADTMRVKLPFGIAQVGKCFRNEITARQFIFRLREFEISEIEYFVEPSTASKEYEKWIGQWEKYILSFGLSKENLKRRAHQKKELAHYSQGTTDIEYKYPFGWGELAGIANRGDFDLAQHEKHSGQEMKFFMQETGKKITPYVIEPTLSLERLMLAIFCEAYFESDGSDGRAKGERVLKIKPKFAPITLAVFPLMKKPELIKIAQEIFQDLAKDFSVEYDESGSIGRRYRRQDEIGTPLCATIDFDSLDDNCVTIRERDTMKQARVSRAELVEYIAKAVS